jgi:hypothetical protein
MYDHQLAPKAARVRVCGGQADVESYLRSA